MVFQLFVCLCIHAFVMFNVDYISSLMKIKPYIIENGHCQILLQEKTILFITWVDTHCRDNALQCTSP